MITIHRAVFEVTDEVQLTIPGFIRPLSIEKTSQKRPHVEMWYEVDIEKAQNHSGLANVVIFAEGTGHEKTKYPVEYIDSVIWDYFPDRLVFHFYFARLP